MHALLRAAFCATLLLLVPRCQSEPRTWSDRSGKFSIEAELVGSADGVVRLRKADGKIVPVPLDRLSEADQAFLAGADADTLAPQGSAAKPSDLDKDTAASIAKLAEDFFEDLRTESREVAAGMLTKGAKAAEQSGALIKALPSPDKGSRAVRVGKTRADQARATVPVTVRAGGQSVKTQLYFRLEEGEWRVAALGATLPQGDAMLDFEAAPPGIEKPREDPLLKYVGKPFPLEGVTQNGRPLDMQAYDGKVVLIDFWATWCGPCRREMPNILANYQKHHDAGFEVVAVSLDEDMKALTEFLAEENPPWAVVADRHPRNKTSMSQRYGVSSIPAFVLIGRDGKVAAVQCRGERLGPALEKALGSAVKVASAR